MTIVGFALFVSACGIDVCDALPVSDDIYSSAHECEQVIQLIHDKHQSAVLICGEIYREDLSNE